MKEEKQKLIPNNLRRWRKISGLTQKQVAKKLALKSTAEISRWETGVCIPKPDNLFDLAFVYRTTSEALYWEYIKERHREIVAKERRSGGNPKP
jgi:transcriptional regulator with XRE-family HTH domain